MNQLKENIAKCKERDMQLQREYEQLKQELQKKQALKNEESQKQSTINSNTFNPYNNNFSLGPSNHASKQSLSKSFQDPQHGHMQTNNISFKNLNTSWQHSMTNPPGLQQPTNGVLRPNQMVLNQGELAPHAKNVSRLHQGSGKQFKEDLGPDPHRAHSVNRPSHGDHSQATHEFDRASLLSSQQFDNQQINPSNSLQIPK